MQQGHIYQLGEHVLGCGDARDKTFVKRVIRDVKIELVAVDVPYGLKLVESKLEFAKLKKNKVIANDQLQSDEEYRTFTKEWIEAIKPHLAKKNSFYIFNSDKMLFALREGMKDADIKFSQLLIWIKNHSVMGRLDYLSQHELIVYGWYGTHQFVKSQDKSVIFYPKPNKSPFHPSTKPIGLLRRLILNSSKIGDHVYDGFLGSGTTLLACEQTKRKCIGIELDPEYCQTTIDRFEKLTGKKAVKIER